mmetsp:Transcript_68987/g.165556  ORF Transcript_68987/g.165556 Transcript_68987/m.165556 type:complete len:123 (+) Transcript_68987:105-473(+)
MPLKRPEPTANTSTHSIFFRLLRMAAYVATDGHTYAACTFITAVYYWHSADAMPQMMASIQCCFSFFEWFLHFAAALLTLQPLRLHRRLRGQLEAHFCPGCVSTQFPRHFLCGHPHPHRALW